MLASEALGGSTAVKGQLLRELLVESKAYGERAWDVKKIHAWGSKAYGEHAWGVKEIHAWRKGRRSVSA